jgi:hypothetical protein
MDISTKSEKLLAYKEYTLKSQADVKKAKNKYKQAEDRNKEMSE